MRKVLGFIGCIVLAGSLFALDYWQGHNNKLTSEQLKQDMKTTCGSSYKIYTRNKTKPCAEYAAEMT